MKNFTKLLLAILPLLLLFTGCSISTANLKDVKMCTEMTEGRCPSDTTVFSSTTPEIFLSTTLKNAPSGTKVSFQWNYLSNGQPDPLDTVSMEAPSEDTTSYLYSSYPIPSSGSWPAGKYEVVLSLNSDNSESIHKEFEIK